MRRSQLKISMLIPFLLYFVLFIFIPLIAVFFEGLKGGWGNYAIALSDTDTTAAIKLTILVALFTVPLNAIFGLAAAWLITKFDFSGRSAFIAIINMPLSVSPVISGLIYILLFGAQTILGNWLNLHNMPIVFATPAIVLATIFVTMPLIARELIPLMQMQGRSEEEAALTLGAGGWKIFYHITLPNIRWTLLYSALTCNARAMGEFGAVSVVSGHVRGLTTTIPLQIELFYNEYNTIAAFALASILTLLTIFALITKHIMKFFMLGDGGSGS